jgi:FdhD protein
MRMNAIKIRLQRLDLEKGVREMEDTVAEDKAVCIFVNMEHYRTLIASPEMIKELAYGHLRSEGLIKSLEEIRTYEINSGNIYLELNKEVELGYNIRIRGDIITTACGSFSPVPLKTSLGDLTISSNILVEAEKILLMVKSLNRRDTIYRLTGGTHMASLCSVEGDILAFAEDVGRHNAVDKVIGAGLIKGVDFERSVLISSGRQSGEMVLKAARCGIPIVASVAAPITSGINIAKAAGITLICFVRGRRMNVLTHENRVLTSNLLGKKD